MNNRLKRLGSSLIVLGLLASALAVATGRGLSGGVARWRCGADYLAKIDGVLSERACGFDADMGLVALVFAVLVLGTLPVGVARYLGRR